MRAGLLPRLLAPLLPHRSLISALELDIMSRMFLIFLSFYLSFNLVSYVPARGKPGCFPCFSFTPHEAHPGAQMAAPSSCCSVESGRTEQVDIRET